MYKRDAVHFPFVYFGVPESNFMNLRLLTILLLVCSIVKGQTARTKTDSVTKLIQRYYNAKDVSALYNLSGQQFREQIPAKKFEEIMTSIYQQLGQMSSYSLVNYQNNVARYKAEFKSPMALLVGLDERSKMQTFLIQVWQDEPGLKKSRVATGNPRVSALEKKIDSLVSPYMEKGNTVGLVIGVLKNGNSTVFGYGETRAGNNVLPDGNTIFEIGSISKTFTAALLADMITRGEVKLTDRADKYLPDSIKHLEYNGAPVTLQSLSNHSSGLPRLPANLFSEGNRSNPYQHYGNAELFSFLAQFKPYREPGKQYEYSNLAVGLLGVILERISGKSYEQLLNERILTPLQMKDTRIAIVGRDSSRFAQGYDPKGTPSHSWEFRALVAAGGIRSTVNDMLLYAKAQVSGNAAIAKALSLTQQKTFEYGNTNVALGWHINTRQGYLQHSGQTGGYFCNMTFDPVNKCAVVILTNGSVETGSIPVELMNWLVKN